MMRRKTPTSKKSTTNAEISTN